MPSNFYTEEQPVFTQQHLWEDALSEKDLPPCNFMTLPLYKLHIFSFKANLFQNNTIGSMLSSVHSISQIYYKLQRKNE